MSWLPDDASWLTVTSAFTATIVSLFAIIGGLATATSSAANRRRVQWISTALQAEPSEPHRDVLARALHTCEARLLAAELYPAWRVVGYSVVLLFVPFALTILVAGPDYPTAVGLVLAVVVVLTVFTGARLLVHTLAGRARAREDVMAGRDPDTASARLTARFLLGLDDSESPAMEVALLMLAAVSSAGLYASPSDIPGRPFLAVGLAALATFDALGTTRRYVRKYAQRAPAEFPESYALSGFYQLNRRLRRLLQT